MNLFPDKFLENYDFHLPEDRIARYPLSERGSSRTLIIERNGKNRIDTLFEKLTDHLDKNDLLIFNNTRVSKRSVVLKRKSGKIIPAVFLSPTETNRWSCLIKGSGTLKLDEVLTVANKESEVEFRYTGNFEGNMPEETPIRCLEAQKSGTQNGAWESLVEAEQFFENFGRPPLPPYLKRTAEEIDLERYQTVYAKKSGSVAAPTAGMHFTKDLIHALISMGIQICEIELTVGYGTFAPLTEENFLKKKLHPENYGISESTATILNNSNRRKIAVGTTTLRALEANSRNNNGTFKAGNYSTDIFLFPPDTLDSVDGLISNFHLPASSLFLLVCAFAGRERILEAYHHAIKNNYRFYSYGDAMLIL